MSAFRSAAYVGEVVHRRLRPKRHVLRYSVFSMLLDVDELTDLDAGLTGFGHNRFAPLSFWNKDHGPRDGSPLRPWAEAALAQADVDLNGGRIRLLCYPRIFGYVFNPISVYFCDDANGRLAAMIYEVGNTFDEKHCYVIPVADGVGTDGLIRQGCRKGFYVSPFIPMEARYEFRLRPPDDALSFGISEYDADGAFLFAGFTAERETLTRGSVFRLLTRYPLMTVKVTAGIHIEALRLWLKRLPVHSHVAAPANPITIVNPTE
jgi:DUF1365 family protein